MQCLLFDNKERIWGLQLTGFTAFTAGVYVGGGMGMLIAVVGGALLLYSAFAFTESRVLPKQARLISKRRTHEVCWIVVALAGWLIPVVTVVLTQSTAVRMIVSILGIAIILVGVLVVLNKAHLKEAIWKA